MSLKTVLFANCDFCGESWQVSDDYEPTAVKFADEEGVIDLCDKHLYEVGQSFGPVLDKLRKSAVKSSSNGQRRHQAPDNVLRPFKCTCGRAFTSNQGLAMHITRSPKEEGHGRENPELATPRSTIR